MRINFVRTHQARPINLNIVLNDKCAFGSFCILEMSELTKKVRPTAIECTIQVNNPSVLISVVESEVVMADSASLARSLRDIKH